MTLAGIGEALWGAADDRGSRSSAWRRYLGVATAVFVLLVLRRVDGLANPQFWAEDGTVFFQQSLQPGCWRHVHTFVHGFPYLGQRLIACTATPVPLVAVPLVYNLVAYVVAAASVAAASLPGFRHVIRSDALRVVLCVAIAALPQATELLGSLVNTAWFLALWLVLLTLMRLPASLGSRSALAVAGVLATFSAPLSPLAAPLWLGRAAYALRSRRLRDAGFALVLAAGVAALVLVAGDLGRGEGTPAHFARAILNGTVVLALADAAIGPSATSALVGRLGAGAAYGIGLAMVALVVALARQTQWRSVPVLLYCAYGVTLANALMFLGRPPLAAAASSVPMLLLQFHGVRGRYHFVPVALVYLAVVATVDRVPRDRMRSLSTTALVVWLVATEAPTLVAPPFHDLGWPAQAARLERKLAGASLAPLTIPVNPDPSGLWFHIDVDPHTIATEVTVPRERIAGSLAGASLAQTFVSRCRNLSVIRLLFGKTGAAATQTVAVALRDEASGRVVASFTLDGSAIVDGASEVARVAFFERQAALDGYPVTHDLARALGRYDYLTPLYFTPVPDSRGVRYVIEVTASGGAPDDSVVVYGSAQDAYADGEARLDGKPLAGDLVFGYGCSTD
jgi:hypothetical protein